MTITSSHFTSEGKPDGGVTQGTGFVISWQRGPLVGDVEPEECVEAPMLQGSGGPFHASHAGPCRRAQNGAFVEEVIEAVIDRLDHYQQTPFACDENDEAKEYLYAALGAIGARHRRRRSEGLEGTSKLSPDGDDLVVVDGSTYVDGDIVPLTATHTCQHCGTGVAHTDRKNPGDESKWVHVRSEMPRRPCLPFSDGMVAFPSGMMPSGGEG